MSDGSFIPVVSFKATSVQMKKLAPIASRLKESGGSVLGQVYLHSRNDKGRPVGDMVFYFVDRESTEIINRGIRKAKFLKAKS